MGMTKEQLKKAMPKTTELIAMFREVFGEGTKVLWAKEGNIEVGKIPACHSVVIEYCPPTVKTTPTRKKKNH